LTLILSFVPAREAVIEPVWWPVGWMTTLSIVCDRL